jgi:hypothetical protein
MKTKKNFINKTFNLVTKNAFDLLPNLTETFDLLKRSSEIRSSDQLPKKRRFVLMAHQSNRFVLFMLFHFKHETK